MASAWKATSGRNCTQSRPGGSRSRSPGEEQADGVASEPSPGGPAGERIAAPEGQDGVEQRVVDRIGDARPDPLEEQHQHGPGQGQEDRRERGPSPADGQQGGDREHREGQERDQEPGAGRPAAGPLRIAQVDQEDGRDHPRRRPRPSPTGVGRRARPIRGPPGPRSARRRAGRGAPPRVSPAPGTSRATPGPAGSPRCGPGRTAPSRGGSSPCPRGTRTRAGCIPGARASARSPPPRTRRGRDPTAAPRHLRQQVDAQDRRDRADLELDDRRVGRQEPREDHPQRGPRRLGPPEEREREEERERRGLVPVAHRRVRVGRRRQAIRQADERRSPGAAAQLARQADEHDPGQRREQARGPQRGPVVGRPVGESSLDSRGGRGAARPPWRAHRGRSPGASSRGACRCSSGRETSPCRPSGRRARRA